MEKIFNRPSAFLFLFLFLLSVRLSASSCQFPDIPNGRIQSTPNLAGERFRNGSSVSVECSRGHRLSSNDGHLVCMNGKWSNTGQPDGQQLCAPVHCQDPPPIINGHYTRENGEEPLPGSESYPYGIELQAKCEHLNFFLKCSGKCGRIRCDPNGYWKTLDGGEFVSSCTDANHAPTVNGHYDLVASIKNYLVPLLTMAVILIVGTISVLMIRHPIFCKKTECGSSSMNPYLPSGGDGGEGGGMHSSSALPPSLDSFPVAMNTGIFVPGARYDLNEMNFQDSPLVGTSVFK